MDNIQILTDLLDFSPALIVAFTGLSMLYIQALKPVWPVAQNYPQLLNIGLALVFATLVTFEVVVVLKILILTYLIMIGASGLYSSATSKTVDN